MLVKPEIFARKLIIKGIRLIPISTGKSAKPAMQILYKEAKTALLEIVKITFGDSYQFNSFAMMNHAGTKLIWGSSRNGTTMYDLNLFLADWTDEPVASSGVLSLILVPFLLLFA
ncbi:hypothetical protein OESDEN_20467 [Oesophagostomum dentatum]|uniref:Uncharacterized protein n=1 Tax=Oesophagostomum dentatum TaxID=61180 RepID=A0A0B1S8K4_OESDE|nr:hypothetical protein OESDEN_20467 [Oesophagostomum dentatum]